MSAQIKTQIRKDAVKFITMSMYKNIYGEISFWAKVETKVKNTSAEQKIEGDSFYDLSVKIQRYINQLQ